MHCIAFCQRILWLIENLKEQQNILKSKEYLFQLRKGPDLIMFLKISFKKFTFIYSGLSKFCKICVETDMSPLSLKEILNSKKFNKLGLLLDLGNTKLMDLNEDYFNFYSEKSIAFI